MHRIGAFQTQASLSYLLGYFSDAAWLALSWPCFLSVPPSLLLRHLRFEEAVEVLQSMHAFPWENVLSEVAIGNESRPE